MSIKESVKTNKSKKKQKKTKTQTKKQSIVSQCKNKILQLDKDQTLKKPLSCQKSQNTNQTQNWLRNTRINKYLEYQEKLFPYINSSAQKGRFLQKKLKDENFYLSPREHTKLNIEQGCSRLVELLREKINSLKIKTITVDYNLDLVNLLIDDYECFNKNFCQFERQYEKIQNIKFQLTSNIENKLVQQSMLLIEKLEQKVLILQEKIQKYRKHLQTFIKVFSKKLEYDYYCLDTPPKIATHFFVLLEKFIYQRKYIFRQYDLIENKLSTLKPFQQYGKQLKRGQLLNFDLKLARDLDKEVWDKNKNYLDLQMIVNKNKTLKKHVQQSNMLRVKSPTDSLQQIIRNTQRVNAQNKTQSQSLFSNIIKNFNQKNDYFDQIYHNQFHQRVQHKVTCLNLIHKLKQELKQQKSSQQINDTLKIKFFYKKSCNQVKVKLVFQSGGLKASKNKNHKNDCIRSSFQLAIIAHQLSVT